METVALTLFPVRHQPRLRMETDLIGMIRVLSAPVLMRVVVRILLIFQPFFQVSLRMETHLMAIREMTRALVSPRFQ